MSSHARVQYLLWFLVAAAHVPTVSAQSTPAPITGAERVEWIVKSTVGPTSLAGGVVSAGWSTLFNSPSEYGPHWAGFGKRYGMRLPGIATDCTIESALGVLWGEDPRYPRAGARPFKSRVTNIIKMTFEARRNDGSVMPAYARYAGIAGNNFLSNAWRADSEATVGAAAVRIVNGFLSQMAGNAFNEFWPDIKQRLRRHPKTPGTP
ncbi:MAG TPA: hypothetical protein VF767_02460 [Bryobacteraceae bacterium]